jgi:hypothetical protein
VKINLNISASSKLNCIKPDIEKKLAIAFAYTSKSKEIIHHFINIPPSGA